MERKHQTPNRFRGLRFEPGTLMCCKIAKHYILGKEADKHNTVFGFANDINLKHASKELKLFFEGIDIQIHSF